MATFGVAGNFIGHLEQVCEAKDFTKIKTKENFLPKIDINIQKNSR